MLNPGSVPSTGGADERTVAIGRLAVAFAPMRLRTLVGSCVALVLYDRTLRLGGIAHIVLPDSRGATDLPAKYADTAVPALLAELRRQVTQPPALNVSAKLIGGACMFQSQAALNPDLGLNVGQRNHEALDRILADLRIPVVARDLGGNAGRRLTLDTATGIVTIKVPGGEDYVL